MSEDTEQVMTLSQNAIIRRMRMRDSKIRIRWDHVNKTPAQITGRLADPVHGSDRLLPDAALEFLEDNRSLFRMESPKAELKTVDQVVDSKGNSCVALQQIYKGIPVEGASMRVQFDAEKSISRVSNKFLPDLDIDTTPKITADQAAKKALQDAKDGKLEDHFIPKLIIYQRKGKQFLAWRIHVDDFENDRELHYFIDAKNGKIIHRYNALMLGQGSGVYSGSGALVSVKEGTDFKLIDSTRTATSGPAIKTCDMDGTSSTCGDTSISKDSNDNWNDSTSTPRKSHQGAEVDVHRYMGIVVDYYKNNFNWNSFDNNGSTIFSGVHHNTDYNNAFYRPSEKKFYFGDGDNSFFGYLAAKDIIAHEFTHGVTAHTSRLGYPDDQAGALNEGFSDIFAMFIDSDDTDMGEEVTTPSIPGDCLRRLNNPADPALGADFRIPNHCVAALDSLGIGYKDTVYNPNWTIKEGDPHVNCGPVIYAGYLLLMGGTHPTSGISVEAIGFDKAAQIFWHVQKIGLNSNSNATFLECREAALNAVDSLYKNDASYLRILDSVKNAFTAVGIGPDIYVRDSLSDLGVVPSLGSLCESPDIIVRSAQVTNPAGTLGNMGDASLSEDVEYGQINYVYVRLQNRGAVNGDVTVSLFWSASTTFGDPSQWTEIGQEQIYNVQPGAVTFVEFPWPANKLPPLGHFCLVCELDDPLDPAPDRSLINSGSMYSKFIAESNNYAWKNINVFDLLPSGLTGIEFDIHGNAGENSDIVVELDRLPEGMDARIRILARICEGAEFINMQFDRANTRYRYYKLVSGRICTIRHAAFLNNDTSTVNVYLKMPDTPNATYEVAVSQYVNGQMVGRVTSIFNVLDENDFSFIGNLNSAEVHKKGCKWIGRMSPHHKVGYRKLDHAHNDGYDNCANCLGGSKR